MAKNSPAQAQPAVAQAPAPAVPFALASRRMSRMSFTIPTTTLSAAANLPISPIQVPAVGYLSGILLEVSLVITASAGPPAGTGDFPFNALASVEFRTAAGNDIIVPFTGYQLYLTNKYGNQLTQAPFSDPRMGKQYLTPAPIVGAVTWHFFLYIPLEIDLGNGYGAIPALASNRSYQLNIIAAAISAFLAGGTITSVTMAINGTAYYWSEPPAVTASGMGQSIAPVGVGTVSQWQYEAPPVTPGDKYIRSNNVGNVLRCLVFVLRTAAGVRTDADWPSIAELYLDNEPMFYLPNSQWEEFMIRRYGFTAATKDIAQGLDTGVYVIPFHALAGALAGDAANGRNQLLPTGDASLLQLRGTSFGASASTLEILTNSVIPTDAASLYAR